MSTTPTPRAEDAQRRAFEDGLDTAEDHEVLNVLEEIAKQFGAAKASGQPDYSLQRKINIVRGEISRRMRP